MSSLITDKLVTPCGKLTNSTLGGYVDAAGNVVGSTGFLANYVVDYAGNLGTLQNVTFDCTLMASIIGSAITPGQWEMQVGTIETVGANEGTITNNFAAGATAPTLLSSFVSVNAIGYLTGGVSGSGTWTIKAGPEAIAGTGYVGSGLLVSTGTNTLSGPIVMEAGTKLQLGANCSNTTTRSVGNLTLNEGARVTQYNGWSVNTFLTQALSNNGTYNVIGCGTCGVGGLGLATTVVNNGVINLDKTQWRNQSTWSGTGTVNVKAGATFQLSSNGIGNTTRVNLNGNGWKDASCVEQGALHAISGSVNHGMRINVQSPSTIKSASGVGGIGLTGVLTGSAPLTVTSFSTGVGGGFFFTNTANTYNGTMTIDKMALDAQYGTSLQFAKMVLVNGAVISSPNTQTIGSLSSSDPTTRWQIGGSNNVFIRDNDVTTFAGRLQMTGSIGNVWLEGGADNVLTLTNTGHTCAIFPRNGSKLILQGATFTGAQGQVRVSAGSTVSAGTSTTGSAYLIYLDATSALDVRAVGASTGIINTGTGTSSLSAGWKVNLLDPLPAGTHVIWKNTGAAITQLPVIGSNLSGRTVTGFVWNNAVSPKTLSVTLV
jgi:hypothetical protein